MFCMKTIGEKVKEFRESKGWNTTRMAKEVGTYRQSIENLEAKGDRKPRYIIDLARVMGMTVDDLMGAATATATLTAPSPTLVATGSSSNQPIVPAVPAQTATENVSPELTEQCRAVMAMLATLPDDPVIRFQVLGQLAEIIAKARGSPPSHQEPPAYSHAATRAA